jgi:hypothetical protein
LLCTPGAGGSLLRSLGKYVVMLLRRVSYFALFWSGILCYGKVKSRQIHTNSYQRESLETLWMSMALLLLV